MKAALGLWIALLVFVSPPATLTAQDIVAHRGASYDAPENTLAAFRLAWKQGADAIEGDFLLTKDQQVVCIHDHDLKRLAKDPRRVADLTLAELKDIDVGSWKAPKFARERIPTLAQVLALVPRGKKLFLEIKSGPEIIAPMSQVLARAGKDAQQIEIICFDADVIHQCRTHLPQYQAHWLSSYKKGWFRWKPSHRSILRKLKKIRATGFDTKADTNRVTPRLVSRLRAAGMEFHCWTVNDLPLARHFQALGVDSITTDRPAWLRAQLTKKPSNQ